MCTARSYSADGGVSSVRRLTQRNPQISQSAEAKIGGRADDGDNQATLASAESTPHRKAIQEEHIMDGLTAPARLTAGGMKEPPQARAGDPHRSEKTRPLAGFGRLTALAGIVFVILDFAADLVIGPFPDGNSSTSTLAKFYAAHHAHVEAGGVLYSLAAIPLVFFGTALWARIRGAALHPAVAALALVGTAVAAVSQFDSGGYFLTVGPVGDKPWLAPAALQALQVGGSSVGYGSQGGAVILLLAVAIAGIAARAFPRSLAWAALVFAVLLLTPVFFLASLVLNVWIIAMSIVLVARPRHDEPVLFTDAVNVR